MGCEILALVLLAIFVELTPSQRIRWEDETTTIRIDYRHKEQLDYDSESKTVSSAERRGGSSNNELVSKQYFPQQPYFPQNTPFQLQYNKYSTQSSGNWGDWSSTQQARKPSIVQFPGETYETSVPATSVNSVSSNSRRKTSSSSSTSVRIDNACHCGMIPYEKDTKKLQRIVGGIVSKDNSWPWMVAVAYMGQSKPFWFCGGSLISDKYVLTAAHCLRTIRNFGLANIKLIMGTNNLMDSKKAIYYSLRAARPHPLYKSGTEDYDIAILEIKETVNYTSTVSPICLSQEGDPYTNRTVTVAGWGSLQNGENPPADLREVDLKVVPRESCQKEYLYNYRTSITASMVCAWLPGKDSCQGFYIFYKYFNRF
ncbi:unnamed protein product [Orchesella dallaii]|uniref:Peptidase S1 domain-containing protein n=1 Tax=Orchesella dallaii TaxID=48710 RepID=A0ABP1Q5F4_9HEXA